MYRKCTTEISVLHQRQVTDTLLALMQKMPYEEITVTGLCQAAGITRRVFYHLFSNKSGALHALIDNKILDVDGYRRDISREALRFFCYWKDQKTFLDALRENDLTGLLLERMIKIALAEDFDLHYWLKSRGWDSQPVIIFTLSGLMGLVYSWYCSGYTESAQNMSTLLEQMLRPLSR